MIYISPTLINREFDSKLKLKNNFFSKTRTNRSESGLDRSESGLDRLEIQFCTRKKILLHSIQSMPENFF